MFLAIKKIGIDRCCSNITIISSGWSRDLHGHHVWGEYEVFTERLIDTVDGNRGKHGYKSINPNMERYLYWDLYGKKWMVSKMNCK